MTGRGKYFLEENKIRLLQDAIHDDNQLSLGLIHKFSHNDDVHFVSFSCIGDVIKFEDSYKSVKYGLPAGIAIAGFYLKISSSKIPEDLKEFCKTNFPKNTKSVLSLSKVQVLIIGGDDPLLYDCDLNTWDIKQLSFSIRASSILDECMSLKLRGCLSLGHKYEKASFRHDFQLEVKSLADNIKCHTTVFRVKDSQILLFNPTEHKINLKCKELLQHINKDDDDEDEYDRKKKLKNTDFSKVVINIDLLSQTSGPEACHRTISCTPIVNHIHGCYEQLDVQLPLDLVAYIHPDSQCDRVHKLLTTAICVQLEAMTECVFQHENGSLYTPVPYHFRPKNLGHLLTVVYPKGVSEEKLEPVRRGIHSLFLLPNDVPQVRRLNCHIFPDEVVPGGYLVNPHIGLPHSGVKGGCVSAVQGLYTYHHYMQDRIDDNGWGCAYRSLQTLISWFRFQGYTDNAIPTHREIQQALVDIGDKDFKFIGTKKWIGSTEVSYVLDHLFGVTSKIMFVSNGAELETKGRELALHFDIQGTPVMIGGGVLAHTILGVDFDEVTGDVKFLILDPHYTGGEDLKFIQDKGWCGWKGPNYWDQHAYYNLCLPQRPIMI